MFKKIYDSLKAHWPGIKTETASWVCYLYFLRFSILLWIIPLLLVWANKPSNVRSLVSGIITPSDGMQYVCVAFFLAASSFVALIMVRVVVINGKRRFAEDPPHLLVWLLANPKRQFEWVAPVLVQLNSVFLFGYFIYNGVSEGVPQWRIAKGLGLGLLLAFAFWYAVTAFYYLTFQPAKGRAQSSAAAHTLLLPRSWMLLSGDGAGRRFGDALEDAGGPRSMDWTARLFKAEGYRNAEGGIEEVHSFSMVAALLCFALFCVLWPLTAPVLVAFWPWVAIVVYLAGAAVFLGVVLFARHGGYTAKAKLIAWKILLAAAVAGFGLSIPWLYFCYDAERFPILALLLILVTFGAWLLGALAFYLDRFRLPVLTTIVILLAIPRIFNWYGAFEEHYLSVSTRQAQANLHTPAEVVNAKLGGNAEQPLIVVTSTGGGIHAAAWTAAVLGQLENEFANDNNLGSFHSHVLLMSTVSGGSAGLYAYLRELYAQSNKGAPDWKRMRAAAGCSSLEAVGWGLVYYDLPKAAVPLLPYILAPSSGGGDLSASPMLKDRTWALRKAFARNLNDPYCSLSSGASLRRGDLKNAQRDGTAVEEALTLGNLDPVASAFPAFTMNTTTVEGGERFLLANYQIPPHEPNPLIPQPAKSFLQTYGSVEFPSNGQSLYTDLPLATGAQLSATFPYVSSAARFPSEGKVTVTHFVDGGYYDNDGTASAIEFLRMALNDPKLKLKAPAAVPQGSMGAPSAKLKILLIEIRNSGDPSASPAEQNAPWDLVDQAMAPLNAFWNAGHQSVTGRNRNDLELLTVAYQDRLDLKHIVIDDQHNSPQNICPGNDDKTDPLNWSLTPAQQCEVDQSANQPSNRQIYQDALNWFLANSGHSANPQRK
jgi:hypothetical protein